MQDLYTRSRLFEALKKCGDDVTRENLIAQLNTLKNYDLMGVPMSFSKDNHQGLRSMQLLKCTGAESYDRLSDFIVSDTDINALAAEMEH